MFHSAEPLFRPSSVAIVGASESGGGGWARAIYRNLEFAGFPTRLYLINPRRDELWGRKVYPDFAALPEAVDLALTIVPAERVPEVLADGAGHGLKAALVYAARFGEGGDEAGAKRADAIRALCEKDGLVVCGPNCMGALALPDNLLFYPALRVRGLPRGSVGVVFQSGGTFMFWLQRAAERGLGFSYAVSSGNEISLDLADYINFMVDDKETETIACMAEGIRRPEALIAAFRRALAADKPIVLLKVGRSDAGKAAALTHTGALASDDAVFDAVCRRYGVVRAHSLDEMIEHCLVLGQRRWPDGRRIAMVGFSGGGKGLFLDYAADEGAEMAVLSHSTVTKIAPLIDPGLPAENPIDCGAGMAPRPRDFSRLCADVVADPGVDILAVQGHLPAGPDDSGDASVFSDIVGSTEKPVIAYVRVSQNVSDDGRAFQAAARTPFVQGLWPAVRTINGLVGFAEARRRGAPPLPAATGDPADLEGVTFESLLAAKGLTLPRSALAATPDEAADCAARIGFPVALKIVSRQASHKTEVGGVVLDLTSQTAVRSAADQIATGLRAHDSAAVIDGFLVQEMVDGVEFILGAREDPQFGPFMVAGPGGVLVEAMGDIALRLLPVSAEDARDMLAALRARAVLGPFRGRPARDTEALVRAMVGLSELFLDHRDHLADLEINPLMLLAEGEGVRAVDVRPVRRTPS